MINQHHAKIIDRLRAAAIDHGEVADLLVMLAECFPLFVNGDSKFCGDAKQRYHFEAVLNTAAFVLADHPEMTPKDPED